MIYRPHFLPKVSHGVPTRVVDLLLQYYMDEGGLGRDFVEKHDIRAKLWYVARLLNQPSWLDVVLNWIPGMSSWEHEPGYLKISYDLLELVQAIQRSQKSQQVLPGQATPADWDIQQILCQVPTKASQHVFKLSATMFHQLTELLRNQLRPPALLTNESHRSKAPASLSGVVHVCASSDVAIDNAMVTPFALKTGLNSPEISKVEEVVAQDAAGMQAMDATEASDATHAHIRSSASHPNPDVRFSMLTNLVQTNKALETVQEECTETLPPSPRRVQCSASFQPQGAREISLASIEQQHIFSKQLSETHAVSHTTSTNNNDGREPHIEVSMPTGLGHEGKATKSASSGVESSDTLGQVVKGNTNPTPSAVLGNETGAVSPATVLNNINATADTTNGTNTNKTSAEKPSLFGRMWRAVTTFVADVNNASDATTEQQIKNMFWTA